MHAFSSDQFIVGPSLFQRRQFPYIVFNLHSLLYVKKGTGRTRVAFRDENRILKQILLFQMLQVTKLVCKAERVARWTRLTTPRLKVFLAGLRERDRHLVEEVCRTGVISSQ